jgi:hypothetical protein
MSRSWRKLVEAGEGEGGQGRRGGTKNELDG